MRDLLGVAGNGLIAAICEDRTGDEAQAGPDDVTPATFDDLLTEVGA